MSKKVGVEDPSGLQLVAELPVSEPLSTEKGDGADINPEDVWDEGRHAWLTLVGGWLAMFTTFGYQNAYGVFQDFYGQAHTGTASQISWIGSMQLFFITSMGLVSGRLVDMGYFRQTLFAGSLLYVFSLFMLSIANPENYYQLFLSQGVGMGIGAGFIYIPCAAVQSHRWRKRRGVAIGVIYSGSAFGGIIFPIMINQLLRRNIGFAWAVRASAFLVLVCLGSANLLIRPRAGLAHPSGSAEPRISLKMLARDLPYMLLIFGAFLSLSGVFYPYFYVQVFARSHGVPESIGFYTLAILNAGSIPGRIIPTILAGKLGVFNSLTIAGVSSAAIIFALFGVHTVSGVIVIAVISGFVSGAYFSLLAIATTASARHPNEIGLRMGLAFALAACGSLIGAPINGALLGSNFAWSRTIIYSGTTILAGTAVLAVSGQLLMKAKGAKF